MMMTLRRVARLQRGSGFPHADQGARHGELPFFKVGDFALEGNERHLQRSNNWVSIGDALRLRATPVPAGTVLLPKIGAALLGNARRLTTRPSVFDNNILGVSPSRAIDSNFLYYWLTTVDLVPLANPGPIPSLNDSAFSDLPVPIQARHRQRAIADFLDVETVRIDALIAKKKTLANLVRARVRRETSALLGMMVHVRRGVEVPSTQWPIPMLRHVARIQGGLTLGGTKSGRTEVRPYLRVANVQDARLDLAEVHEVAVTPAEAQRHALLPGDVLVLEGNGNPQNLGRGCLWSGEIEDCLHQNHVHGVRSLDENLLPEYLDLALRTEFARHFLTGGAGQVSIATLSQWRLGSLRIPLPPVDKQRSLVREAYSSLQVAESLTEAFDTQVGLLGERRQAIITAAVTGELEIPGVAA